MILHTMNYTDQCTGEPFDGIAYAEAELRAQQEAESNSMVGRGE